MKMRKYTADEKMAVVMEMVRSGKSVTQICKENGISDGMAYRWRDEALLGMRDALSDKRKDRNSGSNADKEQLLKIIGQQAVIIEYQKKISDSISR